MAKKYIIAVISVFFIAITLLLAVLTRVWLVSKENKKQISNTGAHSSLTGIYNRYGFDELAEKMITKNPKQILWLHSLILMTLSLLMISMGMSMETRH